jgi:outer membrane protein OmpA-like peptidoglycan-associated protein
MDTAPIQAESYAKERPLAEEHDEAAKAQNRRAHFMLR